jgi:putative heme iron utilization protein
MTTARSFFEALRLLGPLRVISQCGPSTFESICTMRSFSLADGYFNAIDPAFHWHLKLDGFGHLRSRDEIHARSGRRVLFFELRREAGAEPFLTIYLYRRPGAEFLPEQESLFAQLHAELADGATLTEEP